MSNPRLYGPLTLTAERVDKHLQASSPGVYALGEERDGLFVILRVGRSDHDLRSALAAQVGGRYTHFKFRYALSAEDAFGTECELYHSATPDSLIHPSAPQGTGLNCTRCQPALSSEQPRVSHHLPCRCPHATQLLDAYCAALTEFHDAKLLSGTAMNLANCPTIEREAFDRLAAARRRYWDHVTGHGCRLPENGSPRRLEIERLLRTQIRETRLEFIAASSQFDQLIGIALDFPGTADGALARQQAKHLRDAAFQRYDAALRHYAEFVIGEGDPTKDSNGD